MGSTLNSPVKFSVDYPERLSRGILLLKTFFGWVYLGIPHGIILLFYGIAASIVQFIAWWAILFTGVYPKSMFDFVIKCTRWGLRVNAYMCLFTDIYPPFNGDENEGFPLKFSIDYPESLSRGKLLLKAFFGWLYVLLPHGIILVFYAIAADFLLFISWWAILFTGKFPQGMFNFLIGFYRWYLRVFAYYPGYFTDVYPPFTSVE